MSRILFFGTCDFSALHLRALLQNTSHHIEVVTPPVRCHVAQLAQRAGLAIHHPMPDDRCVTVKHSDQFDYGVVVSFGYMLSQGLLKQFRKGSLNVHPSMLPLYRGASPIQHQIMDGVETAGVSVMALDANRFDTGRIFSQSLVDIKGLSFQQASYNLAKQGSVDLLDVLQDYDGYKNKSWIQDGTLATKAPKILKKHAFINLKMTGSQIYQKYLAIGHQFKLVLQFDGVDLQIGKVQSPAITQNEVRLIGVDQKRAYYSKMFNKLYIKAANEWISVDIQNMPLQKAYGVLQSE